MKPVPDLHAAEAAGVLAFERIAGQLSDHLHYGKSAPIRPRCPYRINEKREAWRKGYNEARDDFMKQEQERDDEIRAECREEEKSRTEPGEKFGD